MRNRVLACAVSFLITAGACGFTPSDIPPPNVAVGGACRNDGDCASGACAAGACVECRTTASCGADQACEGGRCVADPVDGPHGEGAAAGLRSTNGARVHIGRVAVVPVTSAEVRR